MRSAPVAVFAAVMALTSAQWAGAQPVEVVSFKRNTSDSRSFSTRTGPDGTTTVTNLSVTAMMLRAVAPELPREIENRPEWASDRYDVIFRGPAGSKPTPDTWRNLLVERFKFQAHIEQREMDGAELVLAGSNRALGPNLRPSTLNCTAPVIQVIGSPPQASPDPARPRWPTREEMEVQCGFLVSQVRGFVVSGGIDMPLLASTLGALIGESFTVDGTGLSGFYAVDLNFTPARSSVAANLDRDDVLKAVELQLGLKFQPAKVPVAVLVIDHIERPSEN